MEIRQILCDHCGEVLWGRKGTADIKKDYIQLQGSMALEKWDLNSAKYCWKFLLPTAHEQLAFCDLKCFLMYMQTRLEQAENYFKTGDESIVR